MERFKSAPILKLNKLIMKDFPLMYKGWLIRKTPTHAKIENPNTTTKFSIEFTKWIVCKEFIDSLNETN